jgi:hypothetical protein
MRRELPRLDHMQGVGGFERLAFRVQQELLAEFLKKLIVRDFHVAMTPALPQGGARRLQQIKLLVVAFRELVRVVINGRPDIRPLAPVIVRNGRVAVNLAVQEPRAIRFPNLVEALRGPTLPFAPGVQRYHHLLADFGVRRAAGHEHAKVTVEIGDLVRFLDHDPTEFLTLILLPSIAVREVVEDAPRAGGEIHAILRHEAAELGKEPLRAFLVRFQILGVFAEDQKGVIRAVQVRDVGGGRVFFVDAIGIVPLHQKPEGCFGFRRSATAQECDFEGALVDRLILRPGIAVARNALQVVIVLLAVLVDFVARTVDRAPALPLDRRFDRLRDVGIAQLAVGQPLK